MTKEDEPGSEHPRGSRKVLESSPGGPSPLPELPEETLRRCIAGDVAATQALVEMYERRIYAYLSRAISPRPAKEALKEIAQNVFVGALGGIGAYVPSSEVPGGAKLSTWLFTIARNAAIDWHRKEGKQPKVLDEGFNADARPSGSRSPEQEARRKELGHALNQAAAELSDELRQVFVLREYEGLAYKEIAKICGVPLSTAKTRGKRARDQMRELMKGYLDEYKK